MPCIIGRINISTNSGTINFCDFVNNSPISTTKSSSGQGGDNSGSMVNSVNGLSFNYTLSPSSSPSSSSTTRSPTTPSPTRPVRGSASKSHQGILIKGTSSFIPSSKKRKATGKKVKQKNRLGDGSKGQ